MLKYTTTLFRRLYSKAYLDLVNRAPEVLGWLYDHLDMPGRTSAAARLRQAQHRPFVKLLEHYRPDVAICTHFLPSEIISWLKRRSRLADPTGDRRHRLRRPRACGSAPTTSTTSSPSRRPASTWSDLGVPAAQGHGLGHPDRPGLRRAEGRARHARKHGLDRTGHDPGLGRRLRRRPDRAPHPALLELRHPAQVVVDLRAERGAQARLDAPGRRRPPTSRVYVQAPGLHRPRWTSTWRPPTSSWASLAA